MCRAVFMGQPMPKQWELPQHLDCVSRTLLCCKSGGNEAVCQAITAYVEGAPLFGHSLCQPDHSSFGLQKASLLLLTLHVSVCTCGLLETSPPPHPPVTLQPHATHQINKLTPMIQC